MQKITKVSVTKLSFLLVITILCGLTCWVVIRGVENETLKTILSMFNYAVVSMISFYFGQKIGKMEKIDSLVEEEKE